MCDRPVFFVLFCRRRDGLPQKCTHKGPPVRQRKPHLGGDLGARIGEAGTERERADEKERARRKRKRGVHPLALSITRPPPAAHAHAHLHNPLAHVAPHHKPVNMWRLPPTPRERPFHGALTHRRTPTWPHAPPIPFKHSSSTHPLALGLPPSRSWSPLTCGVTALCSGRQGGPGGPACIALTHAGLPVSQSSAGEPPSIFSGTVSRPRACPPPPPHPTPIPKPRHTHTVPQWRRSPCGCVLREGGGGVHAARVACWGGPCVER